MLNEFLVGSRGYGPTLMIAVVKLGFELPRRKALELAAWIVTLADPKGDEFDEICRQIDELPRRKALELAAWIVVCADPKGDEFDEICRQIEDS